MQTPVSTSPPISPTTTAKTPTTFHTPPSPSPVSTSSEEIELVTNPPLDWLLQRPNDTYWIYPKLSREVPSFTYWDSEREYLPLPDNNRLWLPPFLADLTGVEATILRLRAEYTSRLEGLEESDIPAGSSLVSQINDYWTTFAAGLHFARMSLINQRELDYRYHRCDPSSLPSKLRESLSSSRRAHMLLMDRLGTHFVSHSREGTVQGNDIPQGSRGDLNLPQRPVSPVQPVHSGRQPSRNMDRNNGEDRGPRYDLSLDSWRWGDRPPLRDRITSPRDNSSNPFIEDETESNKENIQPRRASYNHGQQNFRPPRGTPRFQRGGRMAEPNGYGRPIRPRMAPIRGDLGQRHYKNGARGPNSQRSTQNGNSSVPTNSWERNNRLAHDRIIDDAVYQLRNASLASAASRSRGTPRPNIRVSLGPPSRGRNRSQPCNPKRSRNYYQDLPKAYTPEIELDNVDDPFSDVGSGRSY